MTLFNSLHTAWRGLTGNKLRAALTTLGIIIGVASVIAMLALGNGARAAVEANFRFLGSDHIQITAKQELDEGEWAHELHTPLTALQTNLELAVGEADPAGQFDFIERAQTQADRLKRLINGLLDLSRLEAGADQTPHGPLNLVALVEETSELYASQADQGERAFSLSLPQEALMITGNEAQLRRALSNLLDNAVKFTPAGGAIRVGLDRAGPWIELWVEDTGIGIPADELPHLFSRFHRGRNAAAYPGSGLGLAIVKAIVEGHGGEVRVEETVQGTAS